MGVAYDLMEALDRAGRAIGKAAGQAAEKVKSGYALFQAENELQKLYTQLGKLTAEGCEKDQEEQIKAKIEEKKADVERLREENKAAKDLQFCSSCGAKNSMANDFCGKCGKKL